MRNMKTKKNYLKYIVVALAIVFLITGALLLLEAWESNQGRFPTSETDDGVVEYQGGEYVLKDNIETFLMLGLDKYKGETSSDSHESGTVQADFLMLFVFDNATRKTTAININRDTMANVNRLDISGNKIGTVEKKQIALAYNYAYKTDGLVNCRNTADSVSDLLKNIKVNHYLSLTMDSVIEMNDLVGGVEVTILDDFTGIEDAFVQGEKITLMGEQALRYVRTRYGLEDSKNSTRMARQQQYMEALLNKTIDRIAADETFALTVVDKMSPYIDHNSTEFGLKEFAEKFDDYEFLGIKELEGVSKLGEEFIEFYPDEDALWELVIDLFYTPKANGNERKTLF